MESVTGLTILLAAAIREPLIPLWAMELIASIFLYAWLLCVGACVGSFLNVVIYRLPRRKSIIQPASICPQCGHPIRLRDNIPIFSWLALRGQCRDCRAPISSRYFFVELTVAMIFLGVALIETKLTGAFPRRNWDASRWLISPYDTLPFWSAYGLHVIMLTTLLGAALIDYDGFRTPERIFVPVVALGLLVPLVMPLVMEYGGLPSTFVPDHDPRFAAPLAGWVVGLMAGAVVGGLWALGSWSRWPRFAPAAMLVAVGVVKGWQAVLEIGAASVLLFSITLVILRTVRSSIVVPLAGVTLLVSLPRLMDLDLRLGAPLAWADDDWLVLAGACGATLVLAALAAGMLAPPQYFTLRTSDPTSDEASTLP
jgi:prepilin signal peptidase PulO-like enzyme (type II secretory pathway)